MTIESQGETTTSAPISPTFTSGLTVVDHGQGAETIATCFASVKDFGAKGDGNAQPRGRVHRRGRRGGDDLRAARDLQAQLLAPPSRTKWFSWRAR